ncbi:CoA transferase, partial [Geoglobus sp.]
SHRERVKPEAQIEIYRALEEWAADKSRSEVVEILNNAGLIAVPVMSARDVYETEHFWERGTLRWVDDPIFGEVLVHGATVKMSETPPRIKWVWRPLGADNIRIYHELLGYPIPKLKELWEKGVI